jgi:hypothetical protein
MACGDVIDSGGNFDAEVDAAEPDAGISRRGLESERDFVAGVKTYPGVRATPAPANPVPVAKPSNGTT